VKTSAWRYVVPLGTAFPIALLVLATLGGLSETGLIGIPIVPWYTLFGLPIDLVIRDIATACTVGFALIGGVLAPRPDPYLGKLTSAAALVWLAALLSQIVFTVSEVLALPMSGSFDPTIMRSLLTQTTVGQVILGQIALVAFVALLGWVVLGRTTGWIVLGIAVVAAYLPGLTGHSGIQEGHTSATIALGFHLVSMAVWIGGLIAITLYALRVGVASEKVIRTYSTALKRNLFCFSVLKNKFLVLECCRRRLFLKKCCSVLVRCRRRLFAGLARWQLGARSALDISAGPWPRA